MARQPGICHGDIIGKVQIKKGHGEVAAQALKSGYASPRKRGVCV